MDLHPFCNRKAYCTSLCSNTVDWRQWVRGLALSLVKVYYFIRDISGSELTTFQLHNLIPPQYLKQSHIECKFLILLYETIYPYVVDVDYS